MKLNQLKALDKLAKSDKTCDFLQHVFVNGEYVYACTPYIVVEIRCKELENNVVNPFFEPMDMEKAIISNANNRYVKLDECTYVDDYARWNKWEPNFFSRHFAMEYKNIIGYNPKYLIDIMRVFKTFKINVRFTYNEKNGLVTYEGFDKNYEIRALVLPMK